VAKPDAGAQNGSMRRILLLGAGLALLLPGCSGGSSRSLERYYDPQGQFSAELPAANTVQVLQPQGSTSGPSLVAGVSSVPASPSPAPGGLADTTGGLGTTATGSSDQTQYRVLVIGNGSYSTPQDVARLQLDDPAADLKVQEQVTIGGRKGLLVVADYEATSNSPAYSEASGFLVNGALAYWILAAFPSGQWNSEEADFLRVLRSFRTRVSPGIPIAPLPNTSG
jgi:hypothetical protein